MKTYRMLRRRVEALIVTSALVLFAPSAGAQHSGMPGMHLEQDTHMQQHMSRMQAMMKDMTQMMERGEQLEQHMRQLPETPKGAVAGSTTHAMMTSVEQMNAMMGQMKGMMEQMHAMMKDDGMAKDPTMRRGMDRMENGLAGMSREMKGMLEAMERMHMPKRN